MKSKLEIGGCVICSFLDHCNHIKNEVAAINEELEREGVPPSYVFRCPLEQYKKRRK